MATKIEKGFMAAVGIGVALFMVTRPIPNNRSTFNASAFSADQIIKTPDCGGAENAINALWTAAGSPSRPYHCN